MTTENGRVEIAKAIAYALVSPNESDSNLEAANVVDGLFALMRAVRFLGNTLGTVEHGDYGNVASVESVAAAINTSGARIADAFNTVADAIRERAQEETP